MHRGIDVKKADLGLHAPGYRCGGSRSRSACTGDTDAEEADLCCYNRGDGSRELTDSKSRCQTSPRGNFRIARSKVGMQLTGGGLA